MTQTNAPAIFLTLEFRDVAEKPEQPGSSHYESALLYNPCDGFHVAFARWNSETGEFEGFFDWGAATVPWEAWKDTHFCAWALLPFDAMNGPLRGAFAASTVPAGVASGSQASDQTSNGDTK
jgi:hypothetical protein